MRIIMKSYLIPILFIFTICSSAQAFTLSNSGRVHFPSPKIKIIIASNTCTTAGFNSAAELQTMVREAVDMYWNKISTCALDLEVEGIVSTDTSHDTLLQALQATPVGKILVGCSDDSSLFSSAGILGVGSINTANGDRGGFLINNLDTSFANLEQSEKYATIAHELGHSFGLGHSSDPTALMYYAVGGKVQKNLSIDDYDACTYLYPHDSPVSCGSVTYLDLDKDDFQGPQGKFLLEKKNESSNTTKNHLLLLAMGLGIMLTVFIGRIGRHILR